MKWLHTPKMLITAVISLVIIGLGGIQSGCERRKVGPPESITIAVSAEPLSAPVYIANEKGFFERQGLQVVFQSYTAGKSALAAVIGGKAHFCTVAETPLMFAGLKGEKIYVVTTIADSNKYLTIVARKDKGIAGPKDLSGKTIGVRKGTTGEYFLHAYLTFYRIAEDRIHIVDMQPEELADALKKGDIDAAAAWYPHTAKQQRILGANAITLENQNIYKILWNIAAGQEFAKAYPETIEKLLRALIQAQRYIEEHPKDAQKIVEGYVGAENIMLADFNFDIRLSQTLILSLEEQARWAIRSGLTGKKEIPNFLRMMYAEGMEAVAPDSVTVVHR